MTHFTTVRRRISPVQATAFEAARPVTRVAEELRADASTRTAQRNSAKADQHAEGRAEMRLQVAQSLAFDAAVKRGLSYRAAMAASALPENYGKYL